MKCLQKIRDVGHEQSDDRHRPLLRVHSERPNGD
jgi:hypothetical protein